MFGTYDCYKLDFKHKLEYTLKGCTMHSFSNVLFTLPLEENKQTFLLSADEIKQHTVSSANICSQLFGVNDRLCASDLKLLLCEFYGLV